MYKLLSTIRNRYLLVSVVMLVWMLFFDKYNILSLGKITAKVNQLERDKRFYENEIIQVRQEKEKLQNDPVVIERFARENYYMKRQDEDIYIIVEANNPK